VHLVGFLFIVVAFIFIEYVEPSTVEKESNTLLRNAANEASNETLSKNRGSYMFCIALQYKEKSSFKAPNCSKLSGKKPATHIVISTLKFVEYHSILRLLQDIIAMGAFASLSR
jgi:uncharacterized membrane protein